MRLLPSSHFAWLSHTVVFLAVALALSGCADNEASYVGARAIDPSQQSGLGNPQVDRPILTPPPAPARSSEAAPMQQYQWNGNPKAVVQGKQGANAKTPNLKPQPPSAQSAADSAATPLDANVVEVRPGDTLHGIAERYGVTVASLNQANRLSGAPLQVGQKLVLPPAAR